MARVKEIDFENRKVTFEGKVYTVTGRAITYEGYVDELYIDCCVTNHGFLEPVFIDVYEDQEKDWQKGFRAAVIKAIDDLLPRYS